jgi:hypothetical protein
VERKVKRRIAVGGAVLVALGAAGGAYAVTNSSDNGRDAYLNDVASRLHVTRAQLDAALKGAASDRLDAAVKAGKLTQAQADAIKKRVQQGGAPLLGGPFGGPGPGPGGRPGFGFGRGPGLLRGGVVAAGFQAAAKFLGFTNAQLKQQLESGKSLATIAGDKSKSVSDLEQAIKDAVKTRLDSLVSSKKITQAQEDNLMSRLNANLDNIVKATPPKGKLLRPGRKGGPMLRHGDFRRPAGPRPGGAPGGGPGPGGPPIF